MSARVPSARPVGRGGWFADRPIAVKIGAAVGVLAVVAVSMTVLAVARLGAVESAAARINENVVTLADLANIQRSWQGDRSRYNSYALTDEATRAALRADLSERRTTIEGQLDAYAAVTVNKEAFETFRGHLIEYYEVAAGSCCPRPTGGTWRPPP
jgi:methyl-accepting chemotaxis protein